MSTNEPTDAPAPPALPESWKADDAEALGKSGKGRILWVIGGVLLAGLIAIALFTFLNRDDGDSGPWPDAVNGRPPGLGQEGDTTGDVTPTSEPGVYLWSGFDGWHLWVVNGEGVEGAKGTITSNVKFASADLSAPDDGSVSLDDKEITFDLSAEGLAGIEFNPAFAHQLTFDIDGPDGPIPAELITTGQDHPVSSVPVVVTKPATKGN